MSKSKRDGLAKLLHGREYREEMSDAEEAQAKADGLLVIFGASDDLIEFRGIFTDEVGCCTDEEGRVIYFTPQGPLDHPVGECDCKYCGYEAAKAKAGAIVAQWSVHDYSWFIRTPMPHATFDIVEEGEKYCRGLVIDARDIRL